MVRWTKVVHHLWSGLRLGEGGCLLKMQLGLGDASSFGLCHCRTIVFEVCDIYSCQCCMLNAGCWDPFLVLRWRASNMTSTLVEKPLLPNQVSGSSPLTIPLSCSFSTFFLYRCNLISPKQYFICYQIQHHHQKRSKPSTSPPSQYPKCPPTKTPPKPVLSRAILTTPLALPVISPEGPSTGLGKASLVLAETLAAVSRIRPEGGEVVSVIMVTTSRMSRVRPGREARRRTIHWD